MDALDKSFRVAYYALVATLLGVVVILIGMATYEVFGEAPRRARQDEAAWRERCLAKGGSLIPTNSAWAKGAGTYYTGWICARIERLDV